MKRTLTFVALAATLLSFSCQKGDSGSGKGGNGKTEEEKGLGITIDGKFEDWAGLNPAVVSVAKNDPGSPWSAVSEMRCCADADFVYFYVKYNKTEVKELLEANDELFFRLNLNTDGEFTSGYTRYSLDAYDFIVEGALGDGNGGFADFAGTLFHRTYIEEKGKDDWKELLPSTSGLVSGKGAGNEYEILLARELFNNAVPAEHKMGDEFFVGMRFYQGDWAELSNLPNAVVDEENPNGWGHLLKVTTVK